MGALIPLVLSLAPSLAKWLGGDAAGEVAARAAGVVQAVTGTDDPQQAAMVLSDPAKAAELRLALAKIEADAEAAERTALLADIAGARSQTVALAQAGSNIAWAPAVISAVITAAFFAVLCLVALRDNDWPPQVATVVNVMLGTLGAGFTQVVNYWLGSSSGSKRSGDAVREIAARTHAGPPSVAIATTGPVTTDNLNDASLAQARTGR